MKNNDKITMTVGQLKKLVRESESNKRLVRESEDILGIENGHYFDSVKYWDYNPRLWRGTPGGSDDWSQGSIRDFSLEKLYEYANKVNSTELVISFDAGRDVGDIYDNDGNQVADFPIEVNIAPAD